MSDNSKIEWTGATWHEKSAAKRIGVTADEYISRLALGQKWCTRCKDWHSKGIFPIDRSRADHLAASCRNYKASHRRPSKEQVREKQNASYRRYYASKGGLAIRATKIARRRGIEPLPPEGREFLMESFDGECAYCERPATTIDHILPVKHGGRTIRGNVVPACGHCNSSKGTKSLDVFLEIAANPKIFKIVDELIMEHLV